MKAILAIVLLGLISSSLAYYNVKKVPPTIIDTSFLKNSNTVKKHTFAGLTNLMQQLRDTSAVQSFLSGLLEELDSIRQQKLAIIQQTRESCAEEVAFRQEAIAEGQRSADASQSQLNLATAQKDQALHLRDLAASALVVYQSDLEAVNAARQDQINTLNSRVTKLEAAREAVALLLDLVDAFEAGANSPLDNGEFLQLSNTLLRHSVTTGHSHLVLPVFTKLLQMHARQSVSESDLAEIRRLLNLLDQNAVETLQELSDQEVVDEQAFNDESGRLENLIARLSNQVAVTEQFAALQEQSIAQEESILALSNDKVSRNTDLLEVAQVLCAASEDEWKISEYNRLQQVSIITALSGAVERVEALFEAEVGPQVGDIIPLQML